jgi:hypothetical protein
MKKKAKQKKAKKLALLSSVPLDQKPQLVKYSSDILANNKEIKSLTPEALVKLVQSGGNPIQAWSEETSYGKEDTSKIVKTILQQGCEVIKSDSVVTFLLKQMQTNQSKLVICDMGKEGHGAFTQESINKGEPVAIYCGELKIGAIGLAYGHSISKFDTPRAQEITIDAEQKGNIARFFQHAFDEKTAKIYQEQYGLLSHGFTTANVVAKRVMIADKISIVFFATRKIEPKEIIFCNYDIGYWESRNQRPQSFDKFGVVLPPPLDPFYKVKIIGNKLIEKGIQLLADTKRAQVPLSYQEILKYENTPVDGSPKPCDHNMYIIDHKPLRENLKKNSDHLTLFAQDSKGYKAHPRYKECLLAALKHQTGIDWDYSLKKQVAYTKENKSVFNELKARGFTIQSGTVSSALMNGNYLYLYLNKEADFDKLAEMTPIRPTPTKEDTQQSQLNFS